MGYQFFRASMRIRSSHGHFEPRESSANNRSSCRIDFKFIFWNRLPDSADVIYRLPKYFIFEFSVQFSWILITVFKFVRALRMIYETISGISLLFDTDAFNFGFVFIRISSPSESHFLKFISVGLTHFQINHLAEKWFTYFLRLVCSQLRKEVLFAYVYIEFVFSWSSSCVLSTVVMPIKLLTKKLMHVLGIWL